MTFKEIKNYTIEEKEPIHNSDAGMLSISLNDYLIEHEKGAFVSNEPVTLKQVINYLNSKKIKNYEIYLIEKYNLTIESEEVFEDIPEKEDAPADETKEEPKEHKEFYLITNREKGVKKHFKGWQEEPVEPTKEKPYLWVYSQEVTGNSTSMSEPELVKVFEEESTDK